MWCISSPSSWPGCWADTGASPERFYGDVLDELEFEVKRRKLKRREHLRGVPRGDVEEEKP
jgi:hypothetical protein